MTRPVPSLCGTAARAVLLAAALLAGACGANDSLYERSPSTSTPSGEVTDESHFGEGG